MKGNIFCLAAQRFVSTSRRDAMISAAFHFSARDVRVPLRR